MSMLEGKKNIAVFDFDGTITNKDTLLYFILFTKGYWALWWVSCCTPLY